MSTGRTRAGATSAWRIVQDAASLLARVTTGAIFVAHGLQKYQLGLDAVTKSFAQMGAPLPEVAAPFAMVAELVGGFLLILGLLTPLASLVVLIVMAGAFLFIHSGKGLFVTEGGAELVLALGALALLFLVYGAGRFSVDHLIFRRRRGSHGPGGGP
ncbi:DoxX family protein [Rhizohabitans arisaemae]|uniref:DoxX family protein n=1 Tax=Rhizohabitans arisaemae TaxID=2720610 RepID=UPI0024B0505A|nr:DoxX family protein [Rhizohabitans arisaemae]